MKENPCLTIVTPTFNSEKYLEKCILSIKEQSYKNYEHIIVDGGSTDKTIDLIKRYEGTYPMRWISEPDEGMYDAINKGFRLGKGDIYAWLNSDDFYFPWTFQVVVKTFQKKDIQWLTGIPSNTQRLMDVETTYLLPNLPTVYHSRMISRGLYDGRRMYFVQQESCFWSKKLWEESGGLDKTYKLAGDYFLWKKFAKRERLYTVNCSLASFRIHEKQKSTDIEKYYAETANKEWGSFLKTILQVYLQLYSLKNYRKYVINILEVLN